MKTEAEMIDYDLDVFNALKSFPENDIDSVIYLRGRDSQNGSNKATLFSKAPDHEKMADLILGAMRKTDRFKNAAICAVFNFLLDDKDELDNFTINMNEIINKK